MKFRIILAVLLATGLLCVLSACSSGNDAQLTGKYPIADVKDDPNGATFADLEAIYKEGEQNIKDYTFMEFSEGNRFEFFLFGKEEASGIYTRDGSTLTFNDAGEMTTATISGKKITWIDESGAKLIFEKE